MTDDPNAKHSHPADEKEPSKKTTEEENPKQHGSEVHEREVGGDCEGRAVKAPSGS